MFNIVSSSLYIKRTDREYFLLLRGFSHLLSEVSFQDSLGELVFLVMVMFISFYFLQADSLFIIAGKFEIGLSKLGLREKFLLFNGPAKDKKKNCDTTEEFRGHPRCVTPEIRIWNRLKRCGLQIEATFDIDGTIMIKVRCPTDKLLDEAQALGLKIKTLEGEFLLSINYLY